MQTTDAIQTKVLIIGSGPAGLTAGIYTARAGLEPVLLHGSQPGGQLTVTTDVENYPGFADAVQGPWLIEQMTKQAQHVGVRTIYDHINKIDLSRRPFVVTSIQGNVFIAQSVIIATGATAKWLDIPSEQLYRGYGVSGCATCDGFFFKNKKVLVIGGGNTAVEEALYLANHTDDVTIIHRRDSFRAEKLLQERLKQHSKISIIWNHVLTEVIGDSDPKLVRGAKIQDTVSGNITNIDCDGIFIAIGHTPNTVLFKNQLSMDNSGYIITSPDSTQTSVAGVFAAGDVQDKIFRQAITAAGTGCMAAIEVEKFLASA